MNNEDKKRAFKKLIDLKSQGLPAIPRDYENNTGRILIDKSKLHDKQYRMNNLYHIVDRDGNDIKFVMNPVQEDVFDNLHSRNLILKARQLGARPL